MAMFTLPLQSGLAESGKHMDEKTGTGEELGQRECIYGSVWSVLTPDCKSPPVPGWNNSANKNMGISNRGLNAYKESVMGS